MDSSMQEMHTGRKLSDLASYVVAGLVFLLPIFFIPGLPVPAQFAKTALAILAVVILILIFTFRLLKERSVGLSFSLPVLALLAFPALYLASAAFSGSPSLSFFGYQMEPDTFAFALLSSALAVFVMQSLYPRQIFRVLAALLASAGAVFLFEIVELFFGHALGGGGLFSSPTINLVGTWNSLGVFAGLIAALILVALESLSFSRVRSWLLYIGLLLSLALLIVVNFDAVWIMVATISFCVLVYSLTRSFSRHSSGSGKGTIPAVVVFLCAVFFIFNGSVGNGSIPAPANTTSNIPVKIQNAFGIQTLEVRPSVQSTLAVVGAELGKNPLVGSGPNTFGQDWLLYRPASIISSPFWDVAFPSGFGEIPSSAATGGIVVLLGWIFLAAAICISAGRALLSLPEGESHEYFLTALSAIASLYLLSLHIMYVPEAGLTLLMFVFFGVFLASLKGTKLSRDVMISFVENPRLGFVSVLVGLLIAIGSLAFLYQGGTMLASTVLSNQALAQANAGQLDAAHDTMLSAISLAPQDAYYRALATIELARINTLVQSNASGADAQKKFSDLLSSAIDAGTRATAQNPNGYSNWLTRASVYSSVVPLNITGAYDSAVASLNEARKLNPTTPEIDYDIASMQAVQNKIADAKTSATASLQKKQDYTPAILLLAQLSLTEGNLPEAIKGVNSAVVLDPQNAQLLYQLGLLNLQAKRYDDARTSFEQALSVSPDYANASFFLAQAYYFLGRKDDALHTLQGLEAKNADNTTLKSVIADITAGKNPFTDSSTAVQTPTK
jgi:tetratricopeptide (TPR) repeat protein